MCERERCVCGEIERERECVCVCVRRECVCGGGRRERECVCVV